MSVVASASNDARPLASAMRRSRSACTSLALSPFDESPVRRVIEQLVGGAEVLADVVRLPHDVRKKRQVLVLVTDEVVHGDVARLSVTIEPPVPLLEPRWIPRTVEVQEVTRGALEVEALGRRVGGEQTPDRVRSDR